MMIETKVSGFNFRLPAWGSVGAVILALPELIYGNDAAAVFGTIPLAAVVGLILIVIAYRNVRRQGLAVLIMVCIFFGLAGSLFRASDYLRSTARWVAHSQTYKNQVLAQAASLDGSLKHVEWDGWGFAGAGDTTVYLVSDPNDGLATAALSHLSGKFNGLPCPVVSVHGLEKSWYTVVFYTDTDWNHCV